jgi:ribonucleoside-diphosphate reductase alpha chain
MESMLAGDKAKRKVWTKIIQKRFESGYPYIFFTDTVNRNKPQVYKDKGMLVRGSNLCSEVCLPSSPDESFVCDLSSLNLLNYDEWKDTDVVETLTYFLDAVMSEYVRKTEDRFLMRTVHNFAKRHRAIGIGTLGWHSYLQSKNIAFESEEARRLNVEIHRVIRERADAASVEMARIFGEPEVLKGYGRRNTTVTAIAPTTSSSFIYGQVSQSIEPLNSNYFTKDLAKGKFTYKNPYLKELLRELGKDTDEVWMDVLHHGGSVQHLDFLTREQKDVYKTFGEISQAEVLMQAADRQKWLDQSQSLNLMIHPDTPVKDVHNLLVTAWQIGISSLYYQRSANPSQELNRSIYSCAACEV